MGSPDPIWSTAGITRSHGCMAYEFLAALDDQVWVIPIWDGWIYPYAPSPQALVDEMNSRGILTACGGAWQPSTVRNLLAAGRAGMARLQPVIAVSDCSGLVRPGMSAPSPRPRPVHWRRTETLARGTNSGTVPAGSRRGARTIDTPRYKIRVPQAFVVAWLPCQRPKQLHQPTRE